jgi:uncharacterized membrane protein
MLVATYYGFIDENGCTSIYNETYFGGKIGPGIGFTIETIIMIISAMIIPLMKNKISGEQFNNSQIKNAILMGLAWGGCHFIFQYAGMYGKSCENK